MMLAPATYLGALTIAILVSLLRSYLPAPRLAIAVPGSSSWFPACTRSKRSHGLIAVKC